MKDWLEEHLKAALRNYKQQLPADRYAPSTRDTMVRDAARFAAYLLEDRLDEKTARVWKRLLDEGRL